MRRFLWPVVGFVVIAAVAVALFIMATPRTADGSEQDLARDQGVPIATVSKEVMPLGMSERFFEEKRRATADELMAQF